MANLFVNYHKESKLPPDNRHEHLPIERRYYGELIRGATNYHRFSLPFDLEEISEIHILYAQGTETIIDQEIEFDLNENCDCDKQLTVVLESEDSLKFNFYNDTVYAQLKILTFDGDVFYSPKFRFKIVDTVSTEEELKLEKEKKLKRLLPEDTEKSEDEDYCCEWCSEHEVDCKW